MTVLQARPWPREAIHDTVAAIVKQTGYRRDLRSTLFDRIIGWIADAYGRLYEALSGVPHGRVIATIAAATVALLVIARVAYAARLRAVGNVGAASRQRPGGQSGDSWQEAEALAQRGLFTEAAHALYRATIARLAASGLVRPHESKTSGDYSRELRRRGAPSYTSFRRFGVRYDRIIYGTGICDADDYRVLLEDARVVVGARGAERAA
jgi:hypothetical protein